MIVLIENCFWGIGFIGIHFAARSNALIVSEGFHAVNFDRIDLVIAGNALGNWQIRDYTDSVRPKI